MLDPYFFAALKERQASHVAIRRDLIAKANAAQAEAKRAIFALHRDDMPGADALLAASANGLASIRSAITGRPELADEGAYRAALEEYAEAALYRAWVNDGTVGPVKGFEEMGVDHEIYLGGLADLTGEMQRRQVRLATEGKSVAEIAAVQKAIAEIVDQLLQMDLTGYLRTKFDQTKNNLRRAEDVLYDVTLRRGA
jgi:predicted translin family RNA/ssDNA-binding protein